MATIRYMTNDINRQLHERAKADFEAGRQVEQNRIRKVVEKLERVDYGLYEWTMDATDAQLAHDKQTLLKALDTG